jgi:CRISPR-associated protein Cas6
MTVIELAFPVMGLALPEDNGYGLYAAVSRALDDHLPENIAVASIGGPRLGNWRIGVTRETRLRLRTPADQIGGLLPLAGKYLDVGGHEIGLGIPEVRALTPAAELAARLVTIKGFTEPEPFMEAVARQLEALGVSGLATIPVVPGGGRKGLPQRRVVRIKDRFVVGFAVQIAGLSEKDSLTLQTQGLGGRRHMGCGIFVPSRGTPEAGHVV